jgi:hypothetical protein
MTTPSFTEILDAARARHGAAALEARLPQPKAPAELRAIPDDRYLSRMSLRIFRAGLKHSLVDAKFPAFEEVFHGFDPRLVRAMPDEALDALLGDSRLIRHGGKLGRKRIPVDFRGKISQKSRVRFGSGWIIAGCGSRHRGQRLKFSEKLVSQ